MSDDVSTLSNNRPHHISLTRYNMYYYWKSYSWTEIIWPRQTEHRQLKLPHRLLWLSQRNSIWKQNVPRGGERDDPQLYLIRTLWKTPRWKNNPSPLLPIFFSIGLATLLLIWEGWTRFLSASSGQTFTLISLVSFKKVMKYSSSTWARIWKTKKYMKPVILRTLCIFR